MPRKPPAKARSNDGAPVEKTAVTCAAPDCSNEFAPQRSTARYCSATCRQRAGRARKAAASEKVTTTDPDTGEAEHGLVRAVRQELERAKSLDTVAGQLALQLARRIAMPEEAGLSALSKELRSLLEEAKAGQQPNPADPAPTPEPENDEVAKARKAKEAKAAAAAGGA